MELFYLFLILLTNNSPDNSIQANTKIEKQYIISSDFKQRRNLKFKYNENLYIISQIPGKNSSFKLEYDHKIYKMEIPDILYHGKHYIIDFTILENEIYLLDLNRVYKYQFLNDEFIYRGFFSLAEGFTNIKIIDDILYCYNSMLMDSNKEDTSRTYVFSYNLNSHEKSIKYYPDPVGVSYSLIQPRKLMALSNEFVLLANAVKYQIKIYDHDGRLVDSLTRNPDKWESENAGDVLISDEPIQPQLRTLFGKSKKISLICSIDFLSDKNLLICWSTPNDNGKKEYYYDIWMKSEASWEIEKSDLINQKYDTKTKFESKKLELGFPYTVSNGRILNIEPIPFNLSDLKDETFESGKNKIENYFIENDLRYSIFIREMK